MEETYSSRKGWTYSLQGMGLDSEGCRMVNNKDAVVRQSVFQGLHVIHIGKIYGKKQLIQKDCQRVSLLQDMGLDSEGCRMVKDPVVPPVVRQYIMFSKVSM